VRTGRRWDDARVAAVLAALEELSAATPPPNTPPVRQAFPELFDRWRVVEADPAPFLSTGCATRRGLERSLPAILAAADAPPMDGDRVGHFDVRSDNLCFRDGRAVLVDWNWTSLANPAVDIVGWLPSLRVEGGRRRGRCCPERASWRRRSQACGCGRRAAAAETGAHVRRRAATAAHRRARLGRREVL